MTHSNKFIDCTNVESKEIDTEVVNFQSYHDRFVAVTTKTFS